jgi:RimJ/RimL family protein N-acetyltransferase
MPEIPGSPLDLVTPRLILRRLALPDCAAILAYRGLPEVARYQSWENPDLPSIRALIEQMIGLEPDTPGTWLQLGITLRESGNLIGDCGLHFPADEPRQAEFGITLSPAFQKRGYALEALKAVLAYFFATLGKHRVYASVDPENSASIALLERAGLHKEAHFRQSLWFKGRWVDDVIFAILEQEWKIRARTA